MAEQTLKEKTAKGLFWGGLGNGIQQVLGMALGIYLARILDAEDYGLIGMLAIFSGIASVIINSGFSVALVNKTNATHRDYNAVFWFSSLVGLICYLILFFCAPLIAQFYNRPELTDLSRLVFLNFFLSGCGLVSHTILFKDLMVKTQAQINISSIVLSGVVGVLLAVKGYTYWALAVQSLIFVGGSSILKFIVAPWKPTFEFDVKPIKEMFSFSSKLFLTNIIQQINILPVLLGKYYNATQLGYFTQGEKWMGMGHQVISNMFISISQPSFVQLQEDKVRTKNVFRKLVRFGAFISFPTMLGLAFVAKEFILIFLGEKWLPSVFILQIFCLLGAVGFLWHLSTNFLLSLGKSDIFLYGTLVTTICQILMLFLTLPFGIHIMAIGYIGISFLQIAFWLYNVKKLIGLSLTDIGKDIFPYLAIVCFVFLIGWFATAMIKNIYMVFVMKITISTILYFLLLRITNSVILKESLSFFNQYRKHNV